LVGLVVLAAVQTAAAATTVSQSMATATGAMAKMQQQMNPTKINQTMQQFAKENAKMEMTQEMMADTIDGAMDDEDAEEETGDLVNQVGDLVNQGGNNSSSRRRSSGRSRGGWRCQQGHRGAVAMTLSCVNSKLAGLQQVFPAV
jgi:membrane-bound lytic murein transglycosylase B